MKKLFPIVAFLALVLAGCTAKEEVKADITLSGSSASLVSSGISAPAAGSEVALSFTSALRWTATAEDSGTKAAAGWIVLNPPAGAAGEAKVTILINENPDMAARSGVITLSSGDVSKTIRVSQAAREAIHASQLVLSSATLELNENQTAQLVATIIPSNTDDDLTVEWSSSNPAVATVEDGLVTAVKKGTAKITAKAGELVATCEVLVEHIAVPVSSVTLDKTSLTMTLGQEVTLTATILPADADETPVTWSSSDETVATVSGGVVKAVGEGEAVIKAEAGGKQATCAVSVPHVVIEVESVTLDKTQASLYPGETLQLTATVNPADADDKSLVWASSSSALATVDNNGLVTAVAEGEVTITVTAAGGKQATCALTVAHRPVPVESVTLSQTELTMVLDQEVTLVATVNPSNADDKTVVWNTSNEAVATVSQEGVVKAVGEGEAVITATAGEKSATCAVSVPHVNVPVESVTLNKEDATLLPGETLQLVATVNPSNADDPTITWESSDETVATVTQEGLVKAIKAGAAVITAKAGGKSAICSVTVKANGASGEDLEDPDDINPWL